MHVADKCTYYHTQSHLGRPALESNMKLTQGTYWTRSSSAFFSSVSLFNTARMISCSSSVRKLRSIMMTAAAPPSALHCFNCVANGSTWSTLYALLVFTHWIITNTEWSHLEGYYFFAYYWSSGALVVEDMFCFSWWCFLQLCLTQTTHKLKSDGKKETKSHYYFENMGEISANLTIKMWTVWQFTSW